MPGQPGQARTGQPQPSLPEEHARPEHRPETGSSTGPAGVSQPPDGALAGQDDTGQPQHRVQREGTEGQQHSEQPGLADLPGHQPEPAAKPAAQPCPDTSHPILVGFDGSPASHNALAYATGMARRLAEPLLIVHVAPPGIFCEPLTGMVVGAVADREHMTRWLRGQLLAACDLDGLDVSMVTRCGTPARELAAAATEYHADALIIGVSGRPWHHLAGSVSVWLARHAQCPVIVVP
ncbi:MAG TPA: universal stress protein [Streptosporangiaceae bacterium]